MTTTAESAPFKVRKVTQGGVLDENTLSRPQGSARSLNFEIFKRRWAPDRCTKPLVFSWKS